MVIGSLHRRHPEPARAAAAASPLRGGGRHGVRAHQPDVPADGARHRSAAAARDVRRAEHAALLPERRRLSAAGLPGWMQAIAVVDPFTYAVHAFKSLLLKNTGFEAIAYDLAVPVRLLRRRDDARHACCSSGRCERPTRETRERLLDGRAAALRRARLQGGHRARHLPRGARQRRRGQLSLRRQARALPRGAAGGDRRHARDDTRRRARPARASRRRSSCAVFIHVFLQPRAHARAATRSTA